MSSQPENTGPGEGQPPSQGSQPPVPPRPPQAPAQPPTYGQQTQYEQPGQYGQQTQYGQSAQGWNQPATQQPSYGQPGYGQQPPQYAPGTGPQQYQGAYQGQPGYGQQPYAQFPYAQQPYTQHSYAGGPAPQGYPAPSYSAGPLDPGTSFGFTAGIRSGFRNFANFSGRAGRREFWWWFLFVALVPVVLGTVAAIFFTTGLNQAVNDGNYTEVPGSSQIQVTSNASMIIGFVLWGLTGLFGLLVLLPTIAVGARRLRDAGLSPLLLLLELVPVGGLVLLFLWAQPSKAEAGVFGPSA